MSFASERDQPDMYVFDKVYEYNYAPVIESGGVKNIKTTVDKDTITNHLEGKCKTSYQGSFGISLDKRNIKDQIITMKYKIGDFIINNMKCSTNKYYITIELSDKKDKKAVKTRLYQGKYKNPITVHLDTLNFVTITIINYEECEFSFDIITPNFS